MARSKKMITYKKKNDLTVPLLLVTGAIAFSLLTSFVWHKFYNESSGPVVPILQEDNPEKDDADSAQQSEGDESGDKSGDESQGASEESQQPEESSVPAGPANYEYALPERNRVTTDYFNDAAFVGDSITDGLKVYDIIPNAKVISHTGINLDKILFKQVIEVSDDKAITFLEALKAEAPAKIYVMMGSNDIGFIAKAKFVDLYGQFVDAIKEQHPNSVIYVQAIPPVTTSKSNSDPRYANSKIDEYNQAIMEMTVEKQVHFVYVAEALKNEDGALPEQASPKDGIHFTPTYYNLWLEYLKTHTEPPTE